MKTDKNKPVKEMTVGEFVEMMNESENSYLPQISDKPENSIEELNEYLVTKAKAICKNTGE